MAAVVTAGAVVAILEDGTPAYFYRGAILHDGVPATEVARLEALGLVEGGDAFVPIFPEDVVTRQAPAAGAAGKPRRVSPKDEWVAYAVAQGAQHADAEAMTKDDLVATYGD